MTQMDTSCMSDFDPESLSVDEARERVLAAVDTLRGTERLALMDALDRVLAEDVHATINVPPHRCSAMDGYALRADDLPQDGEVMLSVAGRSLAGHPYGEVLGGGEAVRITTGAVVPDGADLVVMQEMAELVGGAVRIGADHKPGQHVRLAGSDIAQGDRVLSAGTRLGPAELGLLASLGVGEVGVVPQPVVAFFSTGDELAGVGQALQPGQIHDSNRYTIAGMLRHLGAQPLDLGAVPDDRAALSATLQAAAERADAIITSGGVSVGEADYVRELLEEQGELKFWKIAMKPGRPLTLGRFGDAVFFGLPGNPVSVMVTFEQFVKPALMKLMGTAWRPPISLQARSRGALKKAPGRIEYQRGVLYRAEDGEWEVDSTGLQDSHVLSSMSHANCFVVLPLASAGCDAGEQVEVQPFA